AIVATARADPPPALIGSTEDGRLVLFRADRPEAAHTVRPAGLSGRLVGIDTRPADGHLYGLTTSNDLYRIDPATGASTLVSTLTVPFDGDLRSGVAFNPQADRLRLVSADGQNLRVNVVLGATAVDTPLAYAPSDRNAGKRPRIAGAAYTNMVRDAPTTKLFEIDAEQDVLVLQDPPNDGLLTTIGAIDGRRTGHDEAPSAEPSDEVLLGTLGTDPASLGPLYDRYGGLVYGLARAILQSEEEAEDLTQEIFVMLCRGTTYDVRRGSLGAFLTTLTRSRAIDRLRSRGRRLRILRASWRSAPPIDLPAAPVDRIATRECSARVRRAVAELPANERRVLEMVYYQGLTQAEIAATLDAPLGTVKSWCRRGLLGLR